MATDYGLTDDGYTAPRSADFLTLIRDGYEEKTGLTIEWDADTFLGTITVIMADQLGDLAEAGQAVYDAFDVNNASGLQLVNLALIVGVTRTPATYSTCSVTLTGTNGTIVREGSLVEGGGTDGHARWEVTANATIAGGVATVIVQAQEAGATEADAAAIVTIVTPIDGWATVTNANPATVGTDRESDAALRKRRQASLQTAGSRSLNALRANLLDIDGVQAAIVVDNSTGSTAIVEGLSLTAHSIGVVIYPSTVTDAQKETIAETIYDHIPAGIATNGTGTIATVTGADGYAKTIAWDYATDFTVDVAAVLVLGAGYELDDVQEEAEEAIADYFLALDVGEAARILAILALLAAIEGVEGATVTLNAGSVDVDPTATALCVLGTNAVSEAP